MRWLRPRQRVASRPHFLVHRTFHSELRDGIFVPVLNAPTCCCGDLTCTLGVD